MRRFLLVIIIFLLFTSCKTSSYEDKENNNYETIDINVDEGIVEPDNIVVEESESFQNENELYQDDLNYLINHSNKIIENLSYETYKPNENVTYGEFIAYIMRAIGYDLKQENSEDWTYPYIKKAKIFHFIRPGEIKEFGEPINRTDTAIIVSRTVKRIAGRYIYRPSEELEKLILDYDLIDEKYKAYVTKVYDLGIMECYDGNFEPDRLLTKAEVISILRRMVDVSSRKSPELKDISKEISDKEIENELKYIENNISIGMHIDDLEKLFISKYRNFSLEDDMLDYSHSRIRKISFYIYDGNNNYSNFEEGYTFYNDNNREVGKITSIEERYILLDNKKEITYYNVYTDLRVFVYNLLMTRKAGLKIDVYSNSDYKVIGADIFYVTGENNNINLIKYYSDGSKELIENIGENIIDYINSDISSPSATDEEIEENEISSTSAIGEENTVHYVAIEGGHEIVEWSLPYTYYGIPAFLYHLVGNEKGDEWLSQFESHTPDGRDILECNILNFINEMNISKDDFIKADVVPCYSNEEVEALFSGDQKLINKTFINPGALLHNDEIYTSGWLATHDIFDYEEERITKDILIKYLEKIKDTQLREIHDEIYRKINNLITDIQIEEQLEYITSVLTVGKSMEEIHDNFDDLYCNYVINKESFEGIGDCYVYIFNNYDTVLKFSKGDPYYNQDAYLLGTVTETNNDFIIINEKTKVTDFAMYFDLQLFIHNMIVTRKAGLKLDVFTNANNEVYLAKLTYVYGEDNKINMISYNSDGSIGEHTNILDEIHKYLY